MQQNGSYVSSAAGLSNYPKLTDPLINTAFYSLMELGWDSHRGGGKLNSKCVNHSKFHYWLGKTVAENLDFFKIYNLHPSNIIIPSKIPT
jgi:hypothetical protein